MCASCTKYPRPSLLFQSSSSFIYLPFQLLLSINSSRSLPRTLSSFVNLLARLPFPDSSNFLAQQFSLCTFQPIHFPYSFKMTARPLLQPQNSILYSEVTARQTSILVHPSILRTLTQFNPAKSHQETELPHLLKLMPEPKKNMACHFQSKMASQD